MKNKLLLTGAAILLWAFVIVSPQIALGGANAPQQPLLAWTVADDGAVFVLDSTESVYRLSPENLAPQTKSPPLFEAAADARAFLLAGDSYLFVGSEAITQTLILNRSDFSQVASLDRAGPMALDPGRRLFIIWEWAIWTYDLNDLGQPPLNVPVDPAFDPNMGYGSIPKDLVADPEVRQLYVRFYDKYGSPPHNRDSYRIYDMDTLAQGVRFAAGLGDLSRPALAERAGIIVATLYGKCGFLCSQLAIFNRKGQELKSYMPLDGAPATDADGVWIYLLRERGLWVLRGSDLSLQSIMPFTGTPPKDLALSPDGKTLYLFGNGWLTALSAAELQALGIPPIGPFPSAWTYEEQGEYLWPRFYPSPEMEKDGVAFAIVGGYGETYRTADGGRSWLFLPELTYPNFQYVRYLSLSPDFAHDRTLTIPSAGIRPNLRSTDGGDSWFEWEPRIAFVSERDGNREIYTMNQKGGDMRRLTESQAAEENPAWSPAWTRLAFQSDRDGNWDIFTIKSECDPRKPESCDLQKLTDDPADDVLPAWSPDGRSIAFVSTRDGNPEIYIMEKDGGNQRRMTFNPTGDWRPAWMPDSRHLVFTSDRSGNNDIYMLEVPPPDALPLTSELELTPVVTSPADDRDPAVNGHKEMLFLSDRDGIMKTYLMDLNYMPPLYPVVHPYTASEYNMNKPEGHPSWIEDGSGAILVASERDGESNIYRLSYASGYTPLAPSPFFDGHPAWGPVLWRPETLITEGWLK